MPINHEVRDGVLVVTVDNPPVNAISQVERRGLSDMLSLAARSSIRAVVICGANSSFIAGADVREFGKPLLSPDLPDVIKKIEASGKPVIAAIAGQALGGGLEIALGCHYRLATSGAKLGLPEVTLGIVPGAGGTQRLPRLVDPSVAAEMIVSGKPVSASRALEIGLIDAIGDDDIVNSAIELAHTLCLDAIGARRLSERPAPDLMRHREALGALGAKTRRANRGAVAAGEALKLVEAALSLPFAEGILQEREIFLRLRQSDEAAALRYIFFAERQAAKPPENIGKAAPRAIATVGVIGAGTMGCGIAISMADAGLPVLLVEMSADALGQGMRRIADDYATMVSRGRLSAELAEDRIRAIVGTDDFSRLARCDLVIEAAFESMEVKRDIFTRLGAIAAPNAILATNTSYLDLDEIADASGRATDVVGLHYFSPANVMKLLEIVRGRSTAGDVLATALGMAKRTGKISVVAGVCNGFIGNRLLRAYNREAGLLVLEGASPGQVDDALTNFGMAMGPFAVADLSGIDIGYKARRVMAAGSYEPLAFVLHDALVEAGQLGRKTGAGFYIYEPEKHPAPNPALAGLVENAREKAGIVPTTFDNEQIVQRCILAVAREGAAIVAEEIAARPGDIDVVFVNGYGFPRHRGGPIFYADTVIGRPQVNDLVKRYASGRFGHWWELSPTTQADQGND
ncbi:MAG: 3-hydroxyacyl-CoA dehydrogenase [Sphingomonadales bacterium]|nr:3-hydroxyacyl-CoA dehydrogenase [Sphingomonadales bacterium]